jgi:hypothetical protein
VLLASSMGVRLVFTTNQHVTYIIIFYARSHSALGLVLGCAARFRNKLIYKIYIRIIYAKSHSALGLVAGRAARFHNKPSYDIYYNNVRHMS